MDTTPSGYQDGKTLGEVAREDLADLLAQAKAGRVDSESAYALAERTAATFTLSGGGPGSDVTFILEGSAFEGEVIEGWFNYYEIAGSAAIRLDRYDAEALHAALISSPREEDEEDEEEKEDPFDTSLLDT